MYDDPMKAYKLLPTSLYYTTFKRMGNTYQRSGTTGTLDIRTTRLSRTNSPMPSGDLWTWSPAHRLKIARAPLSIPYCGGTAGDSVDTRIEQAPRRHPTVPPQVTTSTRTPLGRRSCAGIHNHSIVTIMLRHFLDRYPIRSTYSVHRVEDQVETIHTAYRLYSLRPVREIVRYLLEISVLVSRATPTRYSSMSTLYLYLESGQGNNCL